MDNNTKYTYESLYMWILKFYEKQLYTWTMKYIYIYIHSDDIWTGMYVTNLSCVHMDNKTCTCM